MRVRVAPRATCRLSVYQDGLRVVDIIALLDVHVGEELLVWYACPGLVRCSQLRQPPYGELAFATRQVSSCTSCPTVGVIKLNL